MADEETPETGDETPAPDKPAVAERSDDDLEKLKAALKKANKEAEQHRLKLKELEDRDKSDAEKLSETNRSLEERARKAEIDACRMRVGLRKGLTEAQVRRLIGDTEEELEAGAADLLDSFKTAEPTSSARPRERLRPGAVPDAEPDPDVDKVVGAIPRHP